MGVQGLGELVKQGRHFQQLIEADSLALQSDVVNLVDKDGDVPFGLIFCPDSDGKRSACNAGDPGSISNPLQYSSVENSMEREACQATVHGITKSQTQLRD